MRATHRNLAHAGLVLAQVTLLEWAVVATGITWDEPKYTGEGFGMVSAGTTPTNPVPSAAFGAAQWMVGERGPYVPDRWLQAPVAPEIRAARVHAARQATVLVAILGGLATAGLATRLSAPGTTVGLLAHALWALSPTLLAHGALATLDVWVASFIAGIGWATERWVAKPTLGRAAQVGAFVALAGCCKIVGFGAILYPLNRMGRSRAAAMMVVATVMVAWGCHQFGVEWVELPLVGPLPMPAPRLVQTLLKQLPHVYGTGHPIGGDPAPPGDLGYYVRALAWKLPASTFGIVVLRLWRRPGERGALLVWPAVLFGLCSLASTQLGVRYLLPAAPFMIVWLAAAAGPFAWVFWGIGAVQVLSAVPHWLTYAGGTGRVEPALRAVVQGSDWCQDREQLLTWLQQNPTEPLYYSGCGGAPPLEVQETPLPCAYTPGTYAVHAVDLYRPGSTLADCLAWLPLERPDHLIGTTVYIWQVPPRP